MHVAGCMPKATNTHSEYTILIAFPLNHSLTPWSRVLLEKLAGLQLVHKFPAVYGTRRFITAFASFRHPSLSWASPIQSTYPQPTSVLPPETLPPGDPSGGVVYLRIEILSLQ